MIPKRMEKFLRDNIPNETWANRIKRINGCCYLEFTHQDVDRLARLNIKVDNLGPRLVVCMWKEDSPLEIGGYLVVDNLAMGKPSMGGIRMLPDVTPSAIHNLARGMTLKNSAADLPFGGGKSGIVADRSLTPTEHVEVVRGFAQLIFPYRDIYLPGPDVGTNDSDMKIIAVANGLDNALSKPAEMGGNCIDELGAAAGGTVIALEALLEVMPKLTALPQFSKMLIPPFEEITVIIQGFGAVGAHAARILSERLPGVKVVGISDALGYLYEEKGLPVEELFRMWSDKGLVTQQFYKDYIEPPNRVEFFKYSNYPNDLLRENAFCLIPAAPIANYLDIDELSNPSTTTDCMGDWWVIVEGANTYSPDPVRKTSRSRMEREVYRRRGVLIATDYLVNSGGVIFAAQEVMIKTPDSLRIPGNLLGDTKAVDLWLRSHQDGFKSLAEKRRIAAGKKRENVIHRNMHEFIELLISDLDMLPCEAAEKISVGRIIHNEQYKRVGDIMVPIPTIHLNKTLQEVSVLLVEKGCSIVAVLSEKDELIGVITEWDITRATARGYDDSINIKNIMSKPAICTQTDTSILDAIRKLEHHDISAMPVVEGGVVKGMISTDLLARNTLYKLLLTNIEI